MSRITPSPPGSAPGARAPLHVFVADAESRTVMTAALQALGLPASLIDDGGIDAALRWVDPETAPPLLLVDLSASAYPTADLAALMAATTAHSRVICFGVINDVALFRDLVATGASDYLVKPLAPEMVLHAVQAAMQAAEQAARAPATDSPAVERQLVAVIGSRGGVGTTTTAINIAWLLAHEHKQKVALVDLDLHFGTAALGLDVEPGGGLWEALEQPGRVDTLFVDRVMARASDTLFVLGAEEPLMREPAIDAAGVDTLLKALAEKFPWMVVDLPRGAGFLQGQVLNAASHILLVCDSTVAGIRDAGRMLEPIKAWAPQAQVLTLAGRTIASLDAKAFERHVGRKLDHVIPFDPKAATEAANAGRPVVQAARGSRIAKAYREVAATLVTKPEDKPAPFWRRGRR